MPPADGAPRADTPPALPGSFDELFRARLLVVTGKGGVGKTTVAAALALAGVASGRRTLLIEVEGRQGFSRAFRTQPWDYEEREFRPDLFGTTIDAEESMYEYLDMYYGLRRMQWVMSRTSALDFVTAAAPGLRDLLLIGKIYEIEKRRRPDGRPTYDLLVLDAPPAGRILPFLLAPEAVTEIVRVGPIRRQSANVTTMLRDPARTAAFVVTLLEDMPATEAVETVERMGEAGIGVGPLIANQVLTPRVSAAELRRLERLGAEGIVEAATDAGAALSADVAAHALELADAHVDRLAMETQVRARLQEQTGLPLLQLPLLAGATFDEADLEVLADHLAVEVGEPGPKAQRVAAGSRALRASDTPRKRASRSQR